MVYLSTFKRTAEYKKAKKDFEKEEIEMKKVAQAKFRKWVEANPGKSLTDYLLQN